MREGGIRPQTATKIIKHREIGDESNEISRPVCTDSFERERMFRNGRLLCL
jgi:hypothetical protein